MSTETDAEFLDRLKRRRGFPTREDVVRMDRIRREGGGGHAADAWGNTETTRAQPR